LQNNFAEAAEDESQVIFDANEGNLQASHIKLSSEVSSVSMGFGSEDDKFSQRM
jgi:hypothetical protein